MKLDAPISVLMTEQVHALDIESNLYDVQELMETKKVRHLPVLKHGKLVGIISKTDIKRLSFNQAVGSGEGDSAIFDMLTLDQVMNHDVQSVESIETIERVARKFARSEYHALPVVSDGNLVGIVTTTDMIKFLLEQ